MHGVLYLGDTSLDTAAAYLAGLMSLWGWKFDYVPSDQPLSDSWLDAGRPLFVVSDYPAARVSSDVQRRIVEQVAAGAGLLMIGGWESFHGLGGEWDGTPVADILPVAVDNRDDRLNCDLPVVVHRVRAHPAVDGLPWDERPPVIGGLNRVVARPEAAVLLEAQQFDVNVRDDVFTFRAAERDVLLVVGQHFRGRTAALMTDVAPHWVGPLVDWGPKRVRAQAQGAPEIEVGSLYAQFLKQLLSWVAGT